MRIRKVVLFCFFFTINTNQTRQTRGQVFQQLLELSEADIGSTFQDIDKCKRLCELLHNAVISNANNRPWLRQVTLMFKLALKELNEIEAPSRKEDNWGKPGEEPQLTESTEFLIKVWLFCLCFCLFEFERICVFESFILFVYILGMFWDWF